MERFDVLSREQNVHHHCLLEASAGTGKTFSIENILVRLLLEGHEPLSIEQILVVTFTREATRDLTSRIRSNLEKALASLETKDSTTDYLLAILEQGDEYIRIAKKRLENALFCFDQAQIFTIHSFCSRMLRNHLFEGDIGIGSINEVQPIPDRQILQIIRDFFRIGLQPLHYSLGQLKIILKENRGSIEVLEQSLLKALKKNLPVEEFPSFIQGFEDFQIAMNEIGSYSADKIIADFEKLAPSYKGISDKSGNIKPENFIKLEEFARLFVQTHWTIDDFNFLLEEGIYFVDALNDKNLKSKQPATGTLHYPFLKEILKSKLHAIVERARNPSTIFARMVYGCQKMMIKYLSDVEMLGYDDLLKAMQRALLNEHFLNNVRKQCRAAIVDEFQDTDPVQWEIIRSLFLPDEGGNLYLVGDPKQSIYAFRQADIYTYLDAAKALGTQNHFSLDTNFRSQPSLVRALNTLFSPKSCPGMISLPRITSELPYNDVRPSTKVPEKNFEDQKGSVHFCVTESSEMESLLFPYFVREIQYLHDNAEIRFNQFAILVSDRYQAQRVFKFLNAHQIPAILQRCESVIESPALPALREMLQAVLNPRRESILKIALGGRIIGWTHKQIRAFSSENDHETVLDIMLSLRKRLFEVGFALFFQELLKTHWHEDEKSVAERLLSQKGGLEFYQNLHQLAHILIEEEYNQQMSPEALLAYMDQIQTLDESVDERIKKIQDPCQDAISILTIHSSKGLEFDIVFTLGLIQRTKAPELFLPVLKKDQKIPHLSVVTDTDDVTYRAHCFEIDAEKMRQLYVAMTRAKFRVYVPVHILPECIEIGSASPMELFLARLGQPPTQNYEEIYERISNFDGKILYNFIETHEDVYRTLVGYAHLDSARHSKIEANFARVPNEEDHSQIGKADEEDQFCEVAASPNGHNPLARGITYTLISRELTVEVSKKAQHPTELIPPPSVQIPEHVQFISSFTTLNKLSSSLFIDAPHDYSSKEFTSHLLPAGRETGVLLHKILEEIPFFTDNVSEFVDPYINGTLFHPWKNVISEMVANALKVPLKTDEDSFCLSEVDSKRCYRETEFLYRCESSQNPDFLKGVMDLFFMHNDKYYLLDWKSNWLGTTPEDYNFSKLEAVMHAENYFLQAQIYQQAAEKYLKLVDPRPFQEIFGGIFYVFLRGVSHSSTGIYYFKKFSS